jgi:hypothetical protein
MYALSDDCPGAFSGNKDLGKGFFVTRATDEAGVTERSPVFASLKRVVILDGRRRSEIGKRMQPHNGEQDEQSRPYRELSCT